MRFTKCQLFSFFFDFSFKECLEPFENVEVVHTKWLLIIIFLIKWCPSFQMGSSKGKWGKVHEDDNFFKNFIIGKLGQNPIGNKNCIIKKINFRKIMWFMFKSHLLAQCVTFHFVWKSPILNIVHHNLV